MSNQSSNDPQTYYATMDFGTGSSQEVIMFQGQIKNPITQCSISIWNAKGFAERHADYDTEKDVIVENANANKIIPFEIDIHMAMPFFMEKENVEKAVLEQFEFEGFKNVKIEITQVKCNAHVVIDNYTEEV